MAAVKRSVYAQKQAERVHGKWDKKHSVIQDTGFKLSEAYAKQLNANYEASGRYYEIDEKANKAYLSSIKGNK